MTTESPMKILFLDDEQPVLNAMRRSLRREGYELFFTTDPDEAMRLIGEQKIDVAVSDHLMPDMTGLEFFGLIRRLHSRVVRIMLTGQADMDTTIRAINEGSVHRFLMKPWDDNQLKQILQETAREMKVRRAQAGEEKKELRPAPTPVVSNSIRRDASGAIVIDADQAS